MARHRQKIPVVFLAGTYTEFIGNRSQPKELIHRPIMFLFGPAGSGKTTVARHYLGQDTPIIRASKLSILLLERVLERSWDQISLMKEENLIVEIPPFITSRPQIKDLLTEILLIRAQKGYRTAVLDSEDNTSLQGLLSSISMHLRICVALRFPEGNGRYRFLAHRCRTKKIPLRYARKLSKVEPWTYKNILGQLEQIEKNFKNNPELS